MADDSLDDMLLEAAGRPKGSSSARGDAKGGSSSSRRPPAKRRGPIRDDSSDDPSDSKSDNDFDEDEDEEYERGRKGGGGDGSKMPLKKRFDKEDGEEGGEGERDGYDSELSFGSDLYKDEEDKARLLAMTELEREMILHDRAEARDNFKMRMKSQQRLKHQMHVKTTAPAAATTAKGGTRERDFGPPSSRMRSSVRETPRTSKENALNELVAKRNRSQQDPDSQRRKWDGSGSGSGAAGKEGEAAAGGRSRRGSLSDSDSSSGADGYDDEESRSDGDRSERELTDDEDRVKGAAEPEAGAEDIKGITIRRSKLAKWFMEPFFEEVIVGCFVRIGIGVSSSGQSIYRVCRVKNVDARDPDKQYKFENRHTYKYLNCVWGDESSSARWQMVRASDQAPTEKEIQDMDREMARCGGRRLSKSAVEKKKEAIAKVSSFVYNAATVKAMLQEKKLATARPSNIALEKDRITKELGVAESRGDAPDVERLQARFKELEELSLQLNKSKDAKAIALAEMNRRNRFENFRNASDMKPVNHDAKAGEAGYDPFSRRWTRSQNYYKTNSPKVLKDREESALAPAEAAKASSAIPLARSDLGARVAPVDKATKLFALHDFDLHISLAPFQQNKGGGGTAGQGAHLAYMSRKQKLEAAWGAQVDDNDGRHHTLTLTVNDYKRRRGLL